MRILIVGTQNVPWMAAGWGRALREMGQDVTLWDWTPFFSPGPLRRVEQRYLLGPGVVRANRALVAFTQQQRPDIVLLYGAWPIWPSTVRSLAQIAWVAGYHNDDPFGGFGKKAYFRYWKQALPEFHSHHVFRQVNVEDYLAAGVLRVKVLLPFYIPWLHVRPELTAHEWGQLGSDVVFVGHGENDRRIEHVVALLEAGIKVRLLGDPVGWKKYLPRPVFDRLQPIQPVLGVDYCRAIAAGKVVLSFFSTGNRDTATFRVFEIPALGGFMMCQRSPLMKELFREDSEAVYFSSPQELVDKCQFYLAHDDLRREIANKGHDRCVTSQHDIHSRMKQWSDDQQAWMLTSA